MIKAKKSLSQNFIIDKNICKKIAKQTNINNKVHDTFVGGYFNTTAAIDEISFKFSSGNIDSGRIALYGIK